MAAKVPTKFQVVVVIVVLTGAVNEKDMGESIGIGCNVYSYVFVSIFIYKKCV